MASEFNVLVIVLLLSVWGTVCAEALAGVFNVKDYGAVADGRTDSTKAFQAAWSAACAVEGKPKILIPKGSYLTGPLMFKGPCKGHMVLQLRGQLLASVDLNAYSLNWIEFQYLNGLLISGRGRFNGQGASAWPHNDCPTKSSCKKLPMSLVFSFVTNATIRGISSVNSKFFHMHVFACEDVEFDSIKIRAPGDSPNTDGIHIAESRGIRVVNSVIGTGDDCVSIGPGNRNLTVANVFCGPGHGISVGSLGKSKEEKDVVGLTVTNCTLNGTTNGLRIKTWQSSPTMLRAYEFVFENITMKDVYNPIIIDQKYCPYQFSCDNKGSSLVKIKNVMFKHIKGTSASPEAIKFLCSDSVPCEGVELSDIDLKYNGDQKEIIATSTCVNVNGRSNGNVNPQSCI